MSARIRKSLREKQIRESESLAVQPETVLSQRLRLDAVRYALDALTEIDLQTGGLLWEMESASINTLKVRMLPLPLLPAASGRNF